MFKSTVIALAVALLLAAPVLAQQNSDPHHADQGGVAAQAAPQAPATGAAPALPPGCEVLSPGMMSCPISGGAPGVGMGGGMMGGPMGGSMMGSGMMGGGMMGGGMMGGAGMGGAMMGGGMMGGGLGMGMGGGMMGGGMLVMDPRVPMEKREQLRAAHVRFTQAILSRHGTLQAAQIGLSEALQKFPLDRTAVQTQWKAVQSVSEEILKARLDHIAEAQQILGEALWKELHPRWMMMPQPVHGAQPAQPPQQGQPAQPAPMR